MLRSTTFVSWTTRSSSKATEKSNMKTQLKGVKYRYLTPHVAGRAVIAYFVKEDKEAGEVSYYAGISYCSPKDHYIKSYGRDKATGRLIQLLSAGEAAFQLAAEQPEKFQLITVPLKEENSVDDFLDVIEEIAGQFTPVAVVKQAIKERTAR